MAIAKKGVYFTALSLLLISLMIFTYTFSDNSFMQKSYIVDARVNTMNDFLDDVYDDMERGMMIAGYRSIISMQKQISVIEDFIDDLDYRFTELYWNGTFNNTEVDLMADAAMEDWGERIAEQAELINLNLSFNLNDVHVNQSSPWDVDIFLNVTVNMSDVNSMASWHTIKIMNQTIPIIEFEDPLYTVKTGDRVLNLIRISNLTDLVHDNDTTNLSIYLNNSYYRASTRAPSFLMRFTGNFSASPYGIESLVNLDEFTKQSLSTYDRSVVDFIYFNSTSDGPGSDWCNVDGMPSWFRMTNNYRGQPVWMDYELDETTLKSNC